MASPLFTVRVPGRAWPTPSVLIPVNSTVLMNCTTNLSLPYWLIDVPAAGIGPKSFVDLGGQETFLNENGLYNLQEVSIDGGPSTLRLLINDTELNNQTVVKCIAGNRDILETTLFIYGMLIKFRCVSRYSCNLLNTVLESDYCYYLIDTAMLPMPLLEFSAMIL